MMLSLARSFILTIACLVAGCESPSAPPESQLAAPGTVPAEPQRAGDPERGRRALLEEPYLGCGIPYRAYLEAGGRDLRAPRIEGRAGLNAELPYFYTAHRTETGVDLVSVNCLVCHGGFFDGRLIIGLGNENLDFTGDGSAFAEAAGAYVGDGAEADEWRRWADRTRVAAAYQRTSTVGVNPAITVTLALQAHRDPKTMAWSPGPRFAPPPPEPIPASVPPWWRLAKKNALYSSAEGRGDQARAMMLGTIFCAEDVATLRKIDAYAPDMRAYFATLQPPAWPFPIDRELAAQGKAVFDRSCATCHGTYGTVPTYPNRLVALTEIGTDPLLAEFFSREGGRFNDWFAQSFFGETARAVPALGYVAPPLDGIWVTAPFLHNGSVPTIAALLDSSKRPRYWTRSFESSAADYDPEALGWRYTELDHGKAGAKDPKVRARIYDTTLPGYSNAGHTFGDGLDGAARKALLEYLKTL